jgi:ABC-type multidrug transport system fused ATPase/permease subunit
MINSAKLTWTRSVLRQSINVLSRKDQKKIILVIVIQILMGLLDLLGVAIFGVLGALAVSGVQSTAPGNRVTAIISFLHLSSFTFQEQAAILGIIATIILVSRTLFSVIFTRRTLFFLSRRGAVISTNLVSRLLAQPLLKIQERSTQDSVYAVTNGVNAITLGVLGAGVLVVSDLSLLLVMSVGLFLVQPTIALSSILVFSLIGFLIYKLMHRRAQELGQEESVLSIESSQAIIEVLSSYREAVVRNRRDFYAREIGEMRWRNANILAELSFMPNISKYVIETTVVIAALAISAAQFIIQDAAHAIATLTIFLAAGTRIAPAVLRVQQGALQIRSSLGVAAPTLSLISDLERIEPLPRVEDIAHVEHRDFDGTIILSNVTLTYPGKPAPALESINLKIESGSSVAFVGPSGAGKTSIVDVILGVLVQDSGEVTISGKNPLSAIETWPGAIGYVPQDVIITSGTFRENVALGYPVKIASDASVSEAIQVAQLSEFISTFPTGVDTQVGERGAKISGGQRQRLGIARAMFTKPKLLVLDEATSALDGETEANISDAISSLKGSVTVVMIAHRLSTVRHADLVVYLEEGRILAQGSFEEVRSKVPGFDRQAQLMGL